MFAFYGVLPTSTPPHNICSSLRYPLRDESGLGPKTRKSSRDYDTGIRYYQELKLQQINISINDTTHVIKQSMRQLKSANDN